MSRKTIFEWAKEYCGDPKSHEQRGALMALMLKREGLLPKHRVLDIGCGALSQGKPLIEYLDPGNYVGLDPNGWLIEAALQEYGLERRKPAFEYSSDFTSKHGPYDFMIAHSVLSHAAQWQLEQACRHLRDVVQPGARWYASLRLADEDTYARNWVYPGVSYFRLDTVKVVAWYAGWTVDVLPEWREAIIETCPNDYHDWVRFTAIPTSEEMNSLRIHNEDDRRKDEGILAAAADLHREREKERLRRLAEEMEVQE